ncbi:MAG TPA: hypothetical protein VIM53_00070 [Candidatus Saccharimonadales bacterium]
MNDLTFIAKSKNGLDVFFDAEGSHAATHFRDAPQLLNLVQEILARTVFEDDVVEFDTDMGRIVGTSDLVTVEPNDELVFAKRLNRDVFTSFNKSKKPQPSSTVSVAFEKQHNGSYVLHSAWIGPISSPAFPGDPNETPESKPYWLSHALAWGTQEVQSGTETSVCPW